MKEMKAGSVMANALGTSIPSCLDPFRSFMFRAFRTHRKPAKYVSLQTLRLQRRSRRGASATVPMHAHEEYRFPH
jgi:hypothetical protein